MLKDCLGKFLNAMQDTNLNVRRVALVTFNSAAHNKPSLVRDLLMNPKQENSNDTFINFLYRETKVSRIAREIKMAYLQYIF
jgi:cullin-associated NEDD8-dissociated protein 1